MAVDERDFSRDMSAFDAWLYRGDENPRTRSVISAAYVLDRRVDRTRFVKALDRASRVVLRFRQRVVKPPVSTVLPSWVVDPDFDLTYHVRFARLPGKAGLQELLDFVQAEATIPLDPARPLWEMVLIEDFEGGRSAMVMKMSHAVTDGAGSLKMFAELFDPEREFDRGPMPPEPVPEDVTGNELLREALTRAPRTTTHVARRSAGALVDAARRTLADPTGALGEAQEYLASLGRVLGGKVEPSPLLKARSLSRRCAVFEFSLADIRRAGKATDSSVNDVYLAGIVGAMYHYHERLGMKANELPLAVPVNLRKGHEAAAGNHFGAVVMAAPIGLADPLERLHEVRARMRSGRDERAINVPSVLASVLSRLPMWMLESMADSIPRADVQASNVAGSPTPFYLAGAKVAHAYAFGPLPAVGAMFTMQSVAGRCYVGLNLDPASFTKPDVLMDAIETGFDEVLALGGRSAGITRPVVSRGLHVRSRR